MWKVVAALLSFSAIRRVWRTPIWAIRNMRSGPRYLSDGERRTLAAMHSDSIRRELANRSAAAVELNDRQEIAYNRLWRSLRPADAQAKPPAVLVPSVPDHVTFALSVVGDYDAVLEAPGPFAACLYRPASDLPYPQSSIRSCCEFLIGAAEAAPGSPGRDHELLTNERDALGFALFSLDYFLDLPAGEIPRQKLQNLAYVKHLYLTGSGPPQTPRAGDTVKRIGSLVTESVNQVIGVGDNDEWMVVTNSGIAMQISRNASSNVWEEVQVIAPAAAAWLSLTPPAGMPTWGS